MLREFCIRPGSIIAILRKAFGSSTHSHPDLSLILQILSERLEIRSEALTLRGCGASLFNLVARRDQGPISPKTARRSEAADRSTGLVFGARYIGRSRPDGSIKGSINERHPNFYKVKVSRLACHKSPLATYRQTDVTLQKRPSLKPRSCGPKPPSGKAPIRLPIPAANSAPPLPVSLLRIGRYRTSTRWTTELHAGGPAEPPHPAAGKVPPGRPSGAGGREGNCRHPGGSGPGNTGDRFRAVNPRELAGVEARRLALTRQARIYRNRMMWLGQDTTEYEDLTRTEKRPKKITCSKPGRRRKRASRIA